MNFCNLGDAVIHPKLGTGRVTKLLGSEGDDGVRIKLDSGKSIDVNYWDDAATKGWRRVKPATQNKMHRKSGGVVEKLIGKVAEAAKSRAIVAVRLSDLDNDSLTGEPELIEAIAEIEDDDPFLVRLDQLDNLVDDSMRDKAAALALRLIQNKFTHIYTG
jgi:hypothetical protein